MTVRNSIALLALLAAFSHGSFADVILEPPPAAVSVSADRDTSTLGETVVFHASIRAYPAPTGTMTFTSDGRPIHGCGSLAVSGSAASCSTGTLGSGDHLIAATYNGDMFVPPVSGTTIARVTTLFLAGTPTKLRDFNGDGHEDLVWVGIDGSVSIWLMDGLSVIGRASVFEPLPPPSFPCDIPVSVGGCPIGIPTGPMVTVLTGDFNGDGKTDVLRELSDGTITIALMNGVDIIAEGNLPRFSTVPPRLVGVADMNGDGKADLLVLDGGNPSVWLLDGTQYKGSYSLPQLQPAATATTSAPGQVTGQAVFACPSNPAPPIVAGDFNGDGHNDLLVSDYLTGAVLYAHIDPAGGYWTSWKMLTPQYSDWSVLRVADFNGDGKADILWRNCNGAVSLWLMDGDTILQRGPLLASPTPWYPLAVGDFDGDGRADIVWRSFDGTVEVSLMNGLATSRYSVLQPAGSAWMPWRAGDLNGDGTTDLLWQGPDDVVGAWTMQAGSLLQRSTIMPPFSFWKPLNP